MTAADAIKLRAAAASLLNNTMYIAACAQLVLSSTISAESVDALCKAAHAPSGTAVTGQCIQ
jgi:hypothetical protein